MKTPKSNSDWRANLAVVFLFAIMIYTAIRSGPRETSVTRAKPTSSTRVSSQFGDKLGAWVITKKFVKDKLKSPSTADFGGVLSGEFQRHEDTVRMLGNGKYQVKGWVDSQNSFGAVLRMDFKCIVECRGNNNWRLLSFEGKQR